MKKSDIVIAILAMRSGQVSSSHKVLRNLSSALRYSSLDLERWDQPVDPDYAVHIIKHISSVRGALTMAMLVQDIDLLLNRMAVRDAAEV